MAIHEWPQQERPREKLFAKGATVLSDAELLAILIGSGTKGKNAVEVARELLIQTCGLRNLFKQSTVDLKHLPGLGQATLARLHAALELSRRNLYEKMQHNNILESAHAVRAFLLAELQDLPYEVFAGLMLDNQHRVINFEIFFKGTVDQAAVYPREIIKKILKCNAVAIIFVHNHPSGSTIASESDIAMTRELQRALKPIGVRLLDHFIVGDGEMTSLVEQGLLPI